MECIIFLVGETKYALSTNEILYITTKGKITRPPQSNDCIVGIMPFRNTTIPIIDLAKRFDIKEDIDKDKILIVNMHDKTYGFLVSKIFNISSPNPIKCDLTFINQKEDLIKDILVNTENDLILLLNKEVVI